MFNVWLCRCGYTLFSISNIYRLPVERCLADVDLDTDDLDGEDDILKTVDFKLDAKIDGVSKEGATTGKIIPDFRHT